MGVSEDFPDAEFMSPMLAAHVYAFMRAHGGDSIERALEFASWDVRRLEQIEHWYVYLAENYHPIPRACHFELMSYLLRHCSRNEGFTRAALEAELYLQAPEEIAHFGFPSWIPSVAMLAGRRLWVPLHIPETTQEVQAYAGLVHHLMTLAGQESDPYEVQATSILWRIAALSDGLTTAEGGLTGRIGDLHTSVCNGSTLSATERAWWEPLLNSQFAHFRNALTHMTTDGREKVLFQEAVEYALASMEDLTSAASAIGCALVQSVADRTVEAPKPRVFDTVWRDLAWIEKRAG